MTSRQTIGWSIVLLSMLATLSIVWTNNLRLAQPGVIKATFLSTILPCQQKQENAILANLEFPELQAAEVVAFQGEGGKSASIGLSYNLLFIISFALLLFSFVIVLLRQVYRIWLLKRALLL